MPLWDIDDKNSVTGLSEAVIGQFEGVFSQKKRIDVVGRSALKGLVFYPDEDGRMVQLCGTA